MSCQQSESSFLYTLFATIQNDARWWQSLVKAIFGAKKGANIWPLWKMGSSRLTHILDSPSSTIYVMFFSNRLGTSTTLLELLQLLLTKCCCVTIHYLVPNLIFNNNVFWVLFFFVFLQNKGHVLVKASVMLICTLNLLVLTVGE